MDLSGTRALIVDDEPDTTTLVKRILQECGAEVTIVASSAEAIGKLSEGQFNVLISDIGMPDDDGYALLRSVRSLAAGNGGIPAIALTAFARDEDRRRAANAGFDQHLAKPVEPAALVAAVANLAKRAADR
jgi:CheY-like chemotaxis protein